jgi:hypothetical protein
MVYFFFRARIEKKQNIWSICYDKNEKNFLQSWLDLRIQNNMSQIEKGYSLSVLLFLMSLNNKNCLSLIVKIQTIGKRILNRPYPLYVRIRALQYMAYYLFFKALFEENRPHLVFITTDSNPSGLAGMHVCRQKNIQSCFLSRGEPFGKIPKVYADMALLRGKHSYQRYIDVGAILKQPLWQGFSNHYTPIKKIQADTDLTLGIFLGKSSTLKNLEHLLKWASENNFKTVIVRTHPNQDFAPQETIQFYHSTKIIKSSNKNIKTDAQACDLILAGNSTVHLENLLFGTPSLYCPLLELSHHDRNQYRSEGLTLQWDHTIKINQINSFYLSSRVEQILRQHLNCDLSQKESKLLFNQHIHSLLSYE